MSSFDKHNPLINKYAQKSWRNMVDMIMMVSLSIQQPGILLVCRCMTTEIRA